MLFHSGSRVVGPCTRAVAPPESTRVAGVHSGSQEFHFGYAARNVFSSVRERRDVSPMDPLAVAVVSIFLSCLAGFAWGRRQAFRTGVRRGDWLCLVCAQRNEFELDRCWSCGREAGRTVHDPSHIPLRRRWPCGAGAAWNGIGRDTCWRGGAAPGASGSRALPPESLALASRGASIPRAPRQSTGADAWKRRNS